MAQCTINGLPVYSLPYNPATSHNRYTFRDTCKKGMVYIDRKTGWEVYGPPTPYERLPWLDTLEGQAWMAGLFNQPDWEV